MSFLRSLLDELVEKRLWPIALLLLITAVAVPLVLGQGGKGAGEAPVAAPANAPADDAASSAPAVQVVGQASVRRRHGKVRDPFRRPTKESAARVATDDGAPAGSTAAARDATSGASAPASGTGTKPVAVTHQGGAAPVQSTGSVYRTTLRWGQDEKAEVRGVSRLEPLGGLSNPALLHLGTTQHGARSIFLLGPNAVTGGEGGCAERTCRVIALKAGQRRIVVVEGADGETRRFELAIDAVVRRVVDSRHEAARLRARVHPDGRDVLRAMIHDGPTAAAIGQFAFDRGLGAVVASNAT